MTEAKRGAHRRAAASHAENATTAALAAVAAEPAVETVAADVEAAESVADAEMTGAAPDAEAAKTETGWAAESPAPEGLSAEPPAPETAAAGEDRAEDAPPRDPGASQSDRFVLPARARVEETEALLLWLRAVPAGRPAIFDASAVESLSTPCALVLVAAARACAAAGAPAAVERPSPAFVDAFSDLGLFQDLMKMEFRP